jgi:hypothetical protein
MGMGDAGSQLWVTRDDSISKGTGACWRYRHTVEGSLQLCAGNDDAEVTVIIVVDLLSAVPKLSASMSTSPSWHESEVVKVSSIIF